ncbi:oligopeptide transport system substrate-binding protein [Desulforamulus putei DSM 12395]|uniref:Oligopeptide transport system substrate-binding protein n=1 Tax=Desulforamulus putei DSM 12395 TaxID=1121429 RepID=A0A1M4SEC5_9FIRM|nr:peptide ABC transporter substrate-binding protein [Desulforamulus putei]SHE30594.1 oligopeptide transport system substrate-binding protein [Desulforamulus putei DSM 12395]
MSTGRRICVLVSLFLLFSFISGCGEKNQPSALRAKEQVIRYNICAEPKTLDPAKANGVPEATVMLQLFDGLTRYDANQQIQPAMAESWQISQDGLTYTFKLRDAKWSNGEPVTARDFVYSWLRALAPETASEYAYQLFYIKGAEEYNSGKGKKEDVGVKALDDKTLQVVLRAPAPQFLGLTSYMTYYPVYRKNVENNDKWFTDPKQYVCNGPFKMVSWEHNQKITLEKNPYYWDEKNVKLNRLEIYLIESLQTGFTMFRSNQLEMQNEVAVQELKSLQGSKELLIVPDASIDYYQFNLSRKPFNDARVRKALAMAIDRNQIVKYILQAGQKPAYAFVPYGMAGVEEKDYRQEGGDLFKEDIETAKKLLAEAGYPDGKGFPKVTLLYNNNENIHKVAQAVQQMWKKNLGIEVALQNVEWQVYLDRQAQQDFDITRTAWSPDYLDPMTFIDLFVSNGGNNNTGWSHPAYDRLVSEANSTGDQKTRMEAMHKAEKILMDHMPVMPIFFYTHPVLIKENIKGVITPSFGTYADFKYAYVE